VTIVLKNLPQEMDDQTGSLKSLKVMITKEVDYHSRPTVVSLSSSDADSAQ